MNTQQHKHSLFSLATMTAYLNGELDTETAKEVEALLARNVEYAEAMEALDREQSLDPQRAFANRDAFEKSMQEQLRALIQPTHTAVVKRFPLRRWLATAAVVLLLLSPFLYQLLRPKATLEQISMAYMDAYAFSGTKGGETSVETLLDSTLMLYEQGRLLYQNNKSAYQDSLPTALQAAQKGFIRILTQPQDSLGIRQYLQAEMGLGVCLLLEGYPEVANEYFQRIVAHGNNEWALDAAWYQGWVYLQLGDKDKAIERFFELSRQKGLYRTPAQNVLDELE